MGNQRTFEDVVEQPAVQQIFSDLDDMAKKMGFGNIKDTKVTGTGAMTQAIRDKAKGEAAGDAIKLQAKTKLLGDIEGDPFNTKGGAQGVGQSTTYSVVSSSILILLMNYIITSLFFKLWEN